MHRMDLFRLPSPPVPPITGRIGYPVGFAAATLTTLAAVAAGATTHPWLALIALSGVAAAVTVVSTPPAAIATAAVCWGMHTGFVLNRRGELSLTTQSRHAAIILAITVLTTYTLATTARAIHRHVAARQALTIPTQRTASTPHGTSINALR